jgi:hypothetical protein
VRRFSVLLSPRLVCALILVGAFGVSSGYCQELPSPPAKPEPKSAEAAEKTPELPAQIELLETRVRFEANGDSRKEVHTRVHINNELGARQFARLAFDYNRSFQQIEFALVRITHAGGGTVDILPSAISDQPNPAVTNAPAYQDVRVKSVRVLGLAPGDLLEYRVVATTSHHPLAPDFWLDHTFDRSGVTANEIFELDLPSSIAEKAKSNQYDEPFRIDPATPITSTTKTGEGNSARIVYQWNLKNSGARDAKEESDIEFSTFDTWQFMSIKLAERLLPGAIPFGKITTYENSEKELHRELDATPVIKAKAAELTKQSKSNKEKLEALYALVSQKISTIDLPLGATGFAPRKAEEVLASGYGTQEDKYVLFAALAGAEMLSARATLTGYCNEKGTPRPSAFQHLLVSAYDGKKTFWLDPSLEVAPFGTVRPSSGKCAFVLDRQFIKFSSLGHGWERLHVESPFAAFQRVRLSATITTDGKLTAKVHYTMRGDNELLLRLAFHQSPKEKWNEVAQLLALSDGFRGKIINVSASDPYATKEPFTVEYEITQPQFVDWSKKPVRIPALLPQVGLPDSPAKAAPGSAASAIDLGTPLDVETDLTLHLPAGTVVHTPTGTSVVRDYATFASKYQARAAAVTASRRLNFLSRQVPAGRAADYNAFVHAVQSDEAQEITLERSAAQPSKQAASATPNPKKN